MQADLDAVTKATELAITRSKRPPAQKADQILLPPDMQQRPLARPLQIALGHSHNIYSHVRTTYSYKSKFNFKYYSPTLNLPDLCSFSFLFQLNKTRAQLKLTIPKHGLPNYYYHAK